MLKVVYTVYPVYAERLVLSFVEGSRMLRVVKAIIYSEFIEGEPVLCNRIRNLLFAFY